MKYLYIYLLLINAAGLLIMRADKRKAIQKARRIPERVLLAVAALGGSVGCLLGMQRFRHKTRHPRFTVGIPLILVLQLMLAALLRYHL